MEFNELRKYFLWYNKGLNFCRRKRDLRYDDES